MTGRESLARVRDEILVLHPDDDDLAAALREEDSFVIYAPLGQRGAIRDVLKALATEQGRRIEVSMPWYGLVSPKAGTSFGDYFYVR